MRRVATALHSLSLDAYVFALLIAGYAIGLAIRFGDVIAGALLIALAIAAIAFYTTGREVTRFVLVYCALGAIAIAPANVGISARHLSAPYEYAHDGMIQTEEAVKFLLAGKNPYAENYLNTPMAQWHFQEPNVPVNPSLYYYVYMPFMILLSVPGYAASQAIVGWFDERMIFVPMFVATLILLSRFVKSRPQLFALMLLVGLNPLFVPYFAEGRNDIVVLFWLVLSLALVKAKRPGWSAVMLALACASKQTAWFIVPFYFIYLAYSENETRSLKRAFANVRLSAALFAAVFAVLVVPFLLWNPGAFIDDVLRFSSGTTELVYPIKSLGFGGIALAFGWIPSNMDRFPFGLLQIIFGTPALILLLRYQASRNTLATVWLNYACLMLVIAFFSRVFNDNYVGFMLALFAIGLLSNREPGPQQSTLVGATR